MGQLSVKWYYQLDDHDRADSLFAKYKGHKLRMTFENGLYIGWIDGVRKVSAESKGELYRKYADEFNS